MYRRPPSLRKNPEGGGTSVHRLRRSRFLALLRVIRALIVWILSHVRHVFESTTLRKNALSYIPYPRVNCLKTICFTATHTHIAHMWQYSPPGVAVGSAVAGSAGSVGWELLAKIFRTSVPGSRGVSHDKLERERTPGMGGALRIWKGWGCSSSRLGV